MTFPLALVPLSNLLARTCERLSTLFSRLDDALERCPDCGRRRWDTPCRNYPTGS